MLSACSGDDIPRETVEPAFAQGGYLKMNLRMPAGMGIRAASNNDNDKDNDGYEFSDGKLEEYTIKDAILILFQGNSEETARFHSAYPMTLLPQMDGSSQVTSISKVVKRIADDGSVKLDGNKLYALVVVNGNGLFSISQDNLKLSVCGQMMEGTDSTEAKTFSDFSHIIATGGEKAFYSANGGFLMTNAPLCNMPGGTVANGEALEAGGDTVHTLAEVTKYVCRTEAEASAKPSTDVFVERALAKVTMTKANGNLGASNIVLDDGSANYLTKKIPWKVLDWQLDVKHQNSYLVRNYDKRWNTLRSSSQRPTLPYRFVGSTPVKQNLNYYRTYWAIDPNYDDYSAGDFIFLSGTFDTRDSSKVFGDDNPQYCMENTFNVDHQRQDRTTRAVVKVQIGDGQDLYVVNGDKTKLYTLEQLSASGLGRTIREAIMNTNNEILVARFKAVLDPTELKDPDSYEFKLGKNDDGSAFVMTVGFKSKKNKKEDWISSPMDVDFVGTWDGLFGLGNGLGVKMYAEGITYYPLRIKHFGDELTPWNNADDLNDIKPYPEPGDIYPVGDANRDGNYLGRYGVVRNNWYNLTVKGIAGLGEPVIPPTTTDPDDELFNYISVSINVLSWTRRDQGAEF